MPRNLEYLTCNYAVSRHRYETVNGTQYLVVPMTMIVPGVLRGSKGSLLYPHDEVNKDPTAWNKIPITLNHPVRNGRNVSAQHEGVLAEQGIGFVDRASSGQKLQAEAWINVQRSNDLDRRIVSNILAGKRIEISTGLFTDNEQAAAGAVDSQGRPYEWIARNYRPDHLAVLLDQKGACSINDGCGLGVNSEGAKMQNHDLEMVPPKINFSITANRGRYEDEYQLAPAWNPSQQPGDDLDMISPPIIGIIVNERRAEMEQLRIERLAGNSATSLSGGLRSLTGDTADVYDMQMPKLNWAQLAERR